MENPFSEDNSYTKNISQQEKNIFSFVYAGVFGVMIGFISMVLYVYYHEDASMNIVLQILLSVSLVSGTLFFLFRQKYKKGMKILSLLLFIILVITPFLFFAISYNYGLHICRSLSGQKERVKDEYGIKKREIFRNYNCFIEKDTQSKIPENKLFLSLMEFKVK